LAEKYREKNHALTLISSSMGLYKNTHNLMHRNIGTSYQHSAPQPASTFSLLQKAPRRQRRRLQNRPHYGVDDAHSKELSPTIKRLDRHGSLTLGPPHVVPELERNPQCAKLPPPRLEDSSPRNAPLGT
jgi:hypothetical protein